MRSLGRETRQMEENAGRERRVDASAGGVRVTRVLFLDDDEERHEAVRRMADLLPQVRIDHVWTAEKARRALDRTRYDLALLDHDLEPLTYAPTPGRDGQAVAAFIVTLPAWRRPRQVVVHSWNPLGAAEMERMLAEAGVPVSRAESGTWRLVGRARRRSASQTEGGRRERADGPGALESGSEGGTR